MQEAFKVNKEDHLQPILSLEAHKALSAAVGSPDPPPSPSKSDGEEEPKKGAEPDGQADWASAQEPALVRILASELDVEPEAIVDFECSLYDTQPAAVSGANSEFLCSSRLDNLASCFVAVEALVAHAEEELASDSEVRRGREEGKRWEEEGEG